MKKRLRLDRKDGHLYWRRRQASDFSRAKYAATWNKKHAGTRAGAERGQGYRVVIVDGERYYEHRVVFALHYGYDPGPLTVDHRTSTNAPKHLRSATNQENVAHRRKPNSNNTSGVHGVWWHVGAGKWASQVKFYGEKVHLGLYATLEEAAKARAAGEAFFFGEFAPRIRRT